MGYQYIYESSRVREMTFEEDYFNQEDNIELKIKATTNVLVENKKHRENYILEVIFNMIDGENEQIKFDISIMNKFQIKNKNEEDIDKDIENDIENIIKVEVIPDILGRCREKVKNITREMGIPIIDIPPFEIELE